MLRIMTWIHTAAQRGSLACVPPCAHAPSAFSHLTKISSHSFIMKLPVVFLPLVAICALHNVERIRPAWIWGGVVLAEVHIGAVKQKQRAGLDLSAHHPIGCLYDVCGKVCTAF